MIADQTPEGPAGDGQPCGRRKRRWRLGILRDRKGAAAVEFALLALPFFILVFASIETFVAFTGETMLAHANETMARKLRTGEITFNLGRSTDMTETQFRQAYCNEISVLLTCSATEVATPAKLFIDARSFSDFSTVPVAIPRVAGDGSDLATSTFRFSPGGPSSNNFLRAYYRWTVVTDLIRPYLTNLRPAGTSMPKDFLILATAAFRNENF